MADVPVKSNYHQLKGRRTSSYTGFTLIEILVGLTIAAIIGAMIASTAKHSLLSSQALLQQGPAEAEKTVLRRILHRDIHNMQWASSLEPANHGFGLTSGHNLLLTASLPVTITWHFTQGVLIRTEERPDLNYTREQVLCPDLNSFELDFMPLGDTRWVGLEAWLLTEDRPPPVALRLRLQLSGLNEWEIIERIPGHDS